MSELRDRAERGFEKLTAVLCRRRWLVLAAVAMIAAGFASGLPRLTTDFSNEAFLHPNDPGLKRYEDFKELFGRDDVTVIAIETKELFSLEALARIKSLHEEITEKVPHLNKVTSLVNARYTYGDGDRLVVEGLMERWPRSPADLRALKARAMANPLYRNLLISEDGRVTAIVIEISAFSSDAGETDALTGFDDDGGLGKKQTPLSTEENRDTANALRAVIEKYNHDGFKLSAAGTALLTDSIEHILLRDTVLFSALSLLLVCGSLFVMFRGLAGVVLPLLVVVITLVSTLGLMGHFGVPIGVTTNILPAFLMSVGVGAALHVLSIYFQHLPDAANRDEAIVGAMGHSGLAIVMTSFTTAAGLASFAAAEVPPVAELGIFSSVGVLLSLFYTIVLLPALLAAVPLGRRDNSVVAGSPFTGRLLDWVTDFSTSNARAVVAASVALIAVFLVSASQLRFTHDPMTWLPADQPIRQATQTIDRELKGSISIEIVVDTGRENGLYDRDILLKLDRLTRDIEATEFNGLSVAKASSVADLLKEVHRALNENDPDKYTIPADAALIPQEFLLFESSGSDDLSEIADSQYRVARVTVRVPWRDVLTYLPLVKALERRFRETLGPGVNVTTTGLVNIFSRTLNAAIRSAAQSYLIAFGVITILMIVLVGNLRLGLASMLPNLAPIVVTMGLMWWMDARLNLFTMLVGSVAIGLAVDDTIHFMHNFRRYFLRTGDVRTAVNRTLHSTGRAMLATSFVLAAGFFVLTFATMNTTAEFGLLTGGAIILALLADFVLAPALMVLLHRAPVSQAIDTPAMESRA